ncbi:uncharacterized protein AB675_3858 [Cyphellophora attinorum]|uniref:Uncharacterized protein n=1 Tax=Cyphellophora attinorum TaxID=1664694 RepID=A0A0N1GXH2_9EURO|nr:uncharacterized protein AB675_3858 [Phialophora attinorum]KPI34926.1 hypothetical protein AB675_3858 [Phialophora attinorum]
MKKARSASVASTDRAPESDIMQGSSQTGASVTTAPPNYAEASASTEKQVQPHDEKEPLASPVLYSADTIHGADKETFSRTTDSAKQVISPIDPDTDTTKIFVPQAPPISMGLEVAAPSSSEAQAIIPPDYSTMENTTSTSSRGQQSSILAFRLEKKHALGLILYQNQQVAINPINITTNQVLPCAFVTSSMSFIEAMLGQPPMFELYIPNTIPTIQAGRWIPLGLEGIIRMRGELEVPVHHSQPTDPKNPDRFPEKWEIRRKGVIFPGRTYDLWRRHPPIYDHSNDPKRPPDLAWKGSTRTVRDTLKQHNLTNLQLNSSESTKHGSLKLIHPETNEVVALWNQWRGGDTLGDLLVFEGSRVKYGISVEAVVVSVIAVVHAERVTGVHWFGGMGK